jgi:hypothetical protein
MYNDRPNLMLGFHGCDQSVRDRLVTNPDVVMISHESFDWLGHGFYIWENNYQRALQWAEDKQKRGRLETPSVVGVVYLLNHCLDFSDSTFIDMIAEYYSTMKSESLTLGNELPKNKDFPKDQNHDLILRELDCYVIEYMHRKIADQFEFDVKTKGFSSLKHFDTVRCPFTEGVPAFEGAGIQSKNHIQICIRNLNCIKGFFIPRQEIGFP